MPWLFLSLKIYIDLFACPLLVLGIMRRVPTPTRIAGLLHIEHFHMYRPMCTYSIDTWVHNIGIFILIYIYIKYVQLLHTTGLCICVYPYLSIII